MKRLAALLALVSTGCTTGLEEFASPKFSHSYECTGGFGFIAQVHGERAWLQFRARTLSLRAVPRQDDLVYRGQGAVLVFARQRAELTFDGTRYKDCMVNDLGVRARLR